jgi:hypothetical protein
MVAGKPVPRLEGARVQPVLNTHWYIQPEPLSEGSLLTFYHPAFGPVGLVIATDLVPDLGRVLTAHVDSAIIRSRQLSKQRRSSWRGYVPVVWLVKRRRLGYVHLGGSPTPRNGTADGFT